MCTHISLSVRLCVEGGRERKRERERGEKGETEREAI